MKNICTRAFPKMLKNTKGTGRFLFLNAVNKLSVHELPVDQTFNAVISHSHIPLRTSSSTQTQKDTTL